MIEETTEEQAAELKIMLDEINEKIASYNQKAKEYYDFCRITINFHDHNEEVSDLLWAGEEIDQDWEPENGWFNERGWHPSQIC